MSMLRWFNREEYNGLSEVLEAIKKELQALQPQDSSDITWSKSSNGISASLKNGSIGASDNTSSDEDETNPPDDTYNGDFTIKLMPQGDTEGDEPPKYKLRVVNGKTYNPSAKSADKLSAAMSVAIGGNHFTMPPVEFPDVLTENSYTIQLVCNTYDSMRKVSKLELVTGGGRGQFTEFSTLIGTVRRTPNGDYHVYQHFTGELMSFDYANKNFLVTWEDLEQTKVKVWSGWSDVTGNIKEQIITVPTEDTDITVYATYDSTADKYSGGVAIGRHDFKNPANQIHIATVKGVSNQGWRLIDRGWDGGDIYFSERFFI